MRVMLPITEKETEKAKIARGFHNARFVCIYDSELNSFECKETKEISPNPGDLTQELKRMGINNVISGYLPPMVLQIFTRNGLSVFKARGSNVTKNIDFFTQNQLESFTSQAARELWGCESGCNSCSSTSCKN
ncbi:hypothetical protein SLH46_06045 [Draconibacterium sp. IB214405]|uniref:hypothetical protein n=1 Tax=Draconibacterium sp. IB214405 TaxID=3097352 RepID=UPI002A1540F1|nr:hypothetical protein [Draconibacterium sp. IB214405]MDX8338733.1 hypothetical protein [Draconibacterium sp. IB214405]